MSNNFAYQALQGPIGFSGISGFSGPGANQTLNTTSNVTFQSVSASSIIVTNPITSPTVSSSYVTVATLSGDITTPAGSDVLMPWQTVVADPNSWLNTSTYRFTPTIPGFYHVEFQVWWRAASPANAWGQNNLQIRKSGSTQTITQTNPLSGNGYSQITSKVIYLNGSGDYLDFTAYSNQSGGQGIQYGGGVGQGTYFSVFLISR